MAALETLLHRIHDFFQRLLADYMQAGLQSCLADLKVLEVRGCNINSLDGFVVLAGFTATNKLHGLMDCSASAFGYAASTYTGQNWGANRLDRVRMGVRSTLVLALSFSALLAAMSRAPRLQPCRIT